MCRRSGDGPGGRGRRPHRAPSPTSSSLVFLQTFHPGEITISVRLLASRDTGSLLLSNFYRLEPLKTCHVKFDFSPTDTVRGCQLCLLEAVALHLRDPPQGIIPKVSWSARFLWFLSALMLALTSFFLPFYPRSLNLVEREKKQNKKHIDTCTPLFLSQ